MISDANLPALNSRSSNGVCKPVHFDIIVQLPDLVGVKHVNHWNMNKASDERIMQQLLFFAEKNKDCYLIFFTRDIGFLYDSHIDPERLKYLNIDIIILQHYVPYLQQQGYRIDNDSIGHGSRVFLQEVMKRAYLIWRQQH